MKKILKVLFFTCPFYLSSELGIISNNDRAVIKELMKYTLNNVLVEQNDYNGHLARFLIIEDMKETPLYIRELFTFSIYDMIYFNILRPAEEEYDNVTLYEVGKCSSKEEKDNVLKCRENNKFYSFVEVIAKYYVDLAQKRRDKVRVKIC